MKLDDLLKQIGEFGPYQKRAFVVAALPSILVAAENLAVIFIFFFPDHRCAIPGLPNDTYSLQSDAHAALINSSIPIIDGRWDSCHLYTEDSIDERDGDNRTTDAILQSNRSQKPCDRWVFDQSTFESTIATDFHLVCGHSRKRADSTTIAEMGSLFGTIVCGLLADKFGRKLVFIVSALALFGGGIGIAFVKSLATLNLSRFVLGFCRGSTFINGCVIGMEMVGPSKRMVAWLGVYIIWCSGAFYLCFFAYFIRSWRYLEIVVSIPGVLLFSYWWLLPESPRWLISKGKDDQAMAIFKKIAESNKAQMPPVEDMKELLEDNTQLSFLHAFRSRELFRRMFIILINIIVNLMSYYGILLNVTNLSGDIYINFTISAALEMLAYGVCLFVLHHLGRKTVYVTCIVVGGACCAVSFVPVLLSSPSWVVVGLSMVGRFFITISLTVIYLYGAELFPTAVRASTIGFCISVGRTGSLIAPYLADLGLLIGGKFRDALPLVVMGSPSILVGLLALWLPETRNRALPEQLEDLQTASGKKTSPKCPPADPQDNGTVYRTEENDQAINTTTITSAF